MALEDFPNLNDSFPNLNDFVIPLSSSRPVGAAPTKAPPTHPRDQPVPQGQCSLPKLSPALLFPFQGVPQQSPEHVERVEHSRTPRALCAPPAASPERGASSTVSYLQSSVGHIQHACTSPQALNEITKFILVEKDTNKKDLKIPRSLAVPQSARPVGELLQIRVCFPFRAAEAAASRIPVH